MKRMGLALVVLCCISTTSHAHVPRIAEPELDIDRADISHAIYGTLEHPDDHFVIRLEFAEPFALPFDILVPRRRELSDHRPAFAVVGPGLPAPTPEQAALLPEPVPPGLGVFLELDEVDPRPVTFESFSRRVFWSSGPIALALAAGEFEIWVFSPKGTTGEFVLAFGVEEDFASVGCGPLIEDWSTYGY